MGWRDRAVVETPPTGGWRTRAQADVAEEPVQEEPVRETLPPQEAKPRRSGRLWEVARQLARATPQLAPVAGLIPDETTARGAMANLLGGASFNFADELTGKLAQRDALLEALRAGTPTPPVDGTYTKARDAFRAREGEFRRDNPVTAFALGAGGGMLTGGPVASNAKGLARYIPAAIEGAISGAGSAETMADVPAMAGGGAIIGGAADELGESVGELGGRLLRGIVRPTAAAQKLQAAGVEGLTTGQLNPDGFLAQIEEASTSVSGVGPAIQGQRQAARQSWQDVVLEQTVAPGAKPPARNLDLPEKVDAIARGFDQAYAPAHGIDMDPATSANVPLVGTKDAPGAFELVVADPTVYATRENRETVGDFLSGQLTLLPKAVGPVKSDVLLKMRSNIRAEARKAAAGAAKNPQLQPVADLFEKAEEAVTDTIERQLPEEVLSTLRDADAAYARFKTVEKAVTAAGDRPTGFTPNDLSNSVKGGTRGFARGGGGQLRELSRAGRAVFDQRSRPTGERLLTLGPLGWVTGPASYFASTPAAQRVLTGQTATQQNLADLLEALSAPAGRSVARTAFDTSISEEEAQREALLQALRNPRSTP